KVVEEYAARLLILINEMDQSIDELKGVQRGQLRCGASWTIGAHLLPRALVQFKQQFPNVEVKLIVGSTPDAEKKIMAGELDVALVAGQISNPAQFKIVHYLTDEFVLITPPSHALAKLQRLSLKQIAKLPLILREKGPLPRLLIDEAFRAAGIPYNCTME